MSRFSFAYSFSLRFITLLLAASFGNFLAHAADQSSVTGAVVDPAGQPVPNVSITLHGRGSSAAISTTSSQTGQFAFARIAPGEYLVDANAPGFTLEESASLTITAGEAKELNLKLALAAVSAQVSVTAANAPQSIDQIAKALDVVDASAIERRGEFGIGQALRLVPGLRVSTRGGPGQLTTIQTRGLRPWDTAILIDGFRLRDATSPQGDASALIQDLFTVDSSRIEVLRGAGSSLYGTNAMGGVVNLISNTGGGATHGDLDLQGGGLGLFRGVARISGGVADNRFTYSAGLSHFNMTEGIDGNDATRNWTGQGSAQYAITPNIRVGARVYSNTGYLQRNSNPVPVDGAVPDASGIIPAIPLSPSQLRRANAGLPYEIGNATYIQDLNDPDASLDSDFTSALFTLNHQVTSKLSYRIGYQASTSRRDNIDGPLGSSFQPLFRNSDLYNGRVDTVQARADYVLGSHQILSGGYEFEREHYLNRAVDQNLDPTQQTRTRTEVSQQSSAVFAQDQIRLLDGRLQVLLSGRFQNFQLERPSFQGGNPVYVGVQIPSPPNAYTGDAAVSYFFRSSNTKLRSHVGNSYRIPSLYERFGTSFFGGFFSPYGDPRLSPERSIAVDVGIDQYFWREKVRLSGTYFYTHLQQVIAFDFSGLINPETDPYARFGGYRNTGGGIARGVEISGEFRPYRTTNLFASYTYTSALDRQSQFLNGVIRSPRIIPNTVTLLATQQIGRRLEATVDFLGGSDYLYPIFGSPYRFDGPRQLGLSANYTLPFWERIGTRLYFRISNTLDQRYYEDGLRNPGRWAVAGLRLSF